jgi:hypothetical protein
VGGCTSPHIPNHFPRGIWVISLKPLGKPLGPNEWLQIWSGYCVENKSHLPLREIGFLGRPSRDLLVVRSVAIPGRCVTVITMEQFTLRRHSAGRVNSSRAGNWTSWLALLVSSGNVKDK